ncbi:MAG: iron ABC transporter permease [Alloprevotella sp.]|nr:iron ABC transporter permease [Alloprevotella sp.]
MRRWNRHALLWPVLTGLLLLLANLFFGSTSLSFGEVAGALLHPGAASETTRTILFDLRLPSVITALLAGSALAVCGLLMQTIFNNPLADPSILGVSSGASLGTAIVVLWLGGTLGSGMLAPSGYMLATLFAWIGAGLVIAFLLLCHAVLRSTTAVLISGVLIGFMVTALTALLSFFSTVQGLHSFMVWTLGSFQNVTWDRMWLFATLLCACFLAVSFLAKPLNVLLLGEAYAQNAGFRVRRIRMVVLVITGLLTATVTVYCGPISFVGLFVPHAVRFMMRSSNHRQLLPATLLWGANTAMLCHWLALWSSQTGVLPVNTITPLLGVPMALYLIVRRND